MANDQAKIGGAYVEISADTTKLDAGLSETQSKVNAATSDISGKFVGVDRSVKQATQSVSQFTKSFNILAGVVGGLVAVYQTLVTVVEYANTTFGNGKRVADEYLSTLSSGAGNVAANLDAVRTRLEQVQSEFARNTEKPFFDIRGRSSSTILEEMKRLREAEAGFALQARAQQLKKEKELEGKAQAEQAEIRRKAMADSQRASEQILKTRQDAQRSAEDAEADGLTGRDRIIAQTNIAISRLYEDTRNINDQTTQELVNRRVAALYRRQEAELAGIVADETERAARAEQDRAKAVADTIAAYRIFQSETADRQQGGYGLGDLKSSLDGLKRSVDSIRGQIR